LLDKEKRAARSIANIGLYVRDKLNGKLLILIDEYDRFANKLLLESFSEPNSIGYIEIVGVTEKKTSRKNKKKENNHLEKGQLDTQKSAQSANNPHTQDNPSGNSFIDLPNYSTLYSLYETLKTMQALNIDSYKVLTAGIFPISLADASGANDIKDIDNFPALSETFGFTENALSLAFDLIGTKDNLKQKAMEIMKTYYDGYLFKESETHLYNPNLCLFFLSKFLSSREFRKEIQNWKGTKEQISKLYDKNVAISSNIFRLLSSFRETQEVIEALLFCRAKNESITTKESEFKNVTVTFSERKKVWGIKYFEPIEKMKLGTLFNVNNQEAVSRILTIMLQYGLVTFVDPNNNLVGIPNKLVFDPFYREYFKSIDSTDVHNLTSFLKDPNEETLSKFIRLIINRLQTPRDNFLYEVGLQMVVEKTLTLLPEFASYDFNYHIKTNENQDYPDFDYKIDCRIRTKSKDIIIEFKRRRSNQILVPKNKTKQISAANLPIGFKFTDHEDKELKRWNPHSDWYESTYKQQQEVLNGMSKEEIENLKLYYYKKRIFDNSKNEFVYEFQSPVEFKHSTNGSKLPQTQRTLCENIKQLLEDAINQTTMYMKLLKETEAKDRQKETEAKTVFAFVVLLIGPSTVIIRPNLQNGKPYSNIKF
jgi:hypothetical protein